MTLAYKFGRQFEANIKDGQARGRENIVSLDAVSYILRPFHKTIHF